MIGYSRDSFSGFKNSTRPAASWRSRSCRGAGLCLSPTRAPPSRGDDRRSARPPAFAGSGSRTRVPPARPLDLGRRGSQASGGARTYDDGEKRLQEGLVLTEGPACGIEKAREQRREAHGDSEQYPGSAGAQDTSIRRHKEHICNRHHQHPTPPSPSPSSTIARPRSPRPISSTTAWCPSTISTRSGCAAC